MNKTIITLILLLLATLSFSQARYAFNDTKKQVFTPATYKNQGHKGFLGERMKVNLEKRLMTEDLESLLAPYKNRPGVQAWAGEYIGKFLHAASLEYENSGNKKLRKRMDWVVR